ncbi:hypothetical protein TeGR_g3556, partial [Tetraparma gracilis]
MNNAGLPATAAAVIPFSSQQSLLHVVTSISLLNAHVGLHTHGPLLPSSDLFLSPYAVARSAITGPVLVLAGQRQHAAHHDALLALRTLLPAASMQPSGPDLYLSAITEKKKDAVRLRAFPFARGHDVSLELLASAISQGLLMLDSPVRLAKKQAMQLASSMFKPRALQALCPPGMRLIVVQLPMKAAMCAAERKIPPGSSVQQINSIAISSEGHAPCVEPARSWQQKERAAAERADKARSVAVSRAQKAASDGSKAAAEKQARAAAEKEGAAAERGEQKARAAKEKQQRKERAAQEAAARKEQAAQ